MRYYLRSDTIVLFNIEFEGKELVGGNICKSITMSAFRRNVSKSFYFNIFGICICVYKMHTSKLRHKIQVKFSACGTHSANGQHFDSRCFRLIVSDDAP